MPATKTSPHLWSPSGETLHTDFVVALYDVITADNSDAQIPNESETETPLCLVFEWMEHDLRAVPSDHYQENSNLPKVIAKSVLSALALLKTEYGAIHTGEHLSLPM